MRLIKQLGVGHHPFSKKYEFKGYFNEPTPTLIATDYKAPKTVLELWSDEDNEKESDNMTKSSERYNADEQADFIQTETEEWETEFAIREEEGNLDPIPPKENIRTKQHEFTYIDLFSGVGGFRQALDSLGGTCVMASEIDKFAEQAYQALYGHATVGDITKVKAEDVPNHDVLVGGFPCQSFSVAGKRKGFEDTRGTMFFEIARIVSVKKPKILLLENVKGLVNHGKGRTLDTMIEILNEIGYVVDFDVLNSKFFGVPQNRERVFIVAIRKDLIESEPFSEESMKGNTIVPKRKRQINEWAETFNFDWPQNDEVTTRLRDILEKEVDEKYYLSEDKTAKLVAQLEEKDKAVGSVGHHPFSKKYEFNGYNSEVSPSLIATDYKAPKTVLESEPQMLGHLDMKGIDQMKRVYSAESVGPTLTTMGGGNTEPKIATLGNVSNTGHGSENIHDIDGLSPTVTSRDYKGAKLVADDSSNVSRYRIRKLTPRECWRLQNFPDDVFDKVKVAGLSDSQLYKQAGNAITVSVVKAIGERLLPILENDSVE